VRPRTGVQEKAVRAVVRAVEVLTELALVVRLRERDLEPQLVSEAPDPDLELPEGETTVVGSIAAAEHVEVHAVNDLDPVAQAA
jgi:hypothetical protein